LPETPENLKFPPELIAAAQSGNDDALETLAIRITGQVLVFVHAARGRGHYRFVGEKTVLTERDIVQDVWMKVLANLDKCDPTRFGGWLRRIVENHLISLCRWREAQLRDHRRTKSLQDPLPGADSETDQRTLLDMQVVSDGVEEVERSERAGCARMFIECIENSDHRKMVRLYYFEGYTQQEIAEIVGMSPGGVAAALSRAVKTMQKSIPRIGL
jgi:RNA polymerase sigma factor (sigma-70 family)